MAANLMITNCKDVTTCSLIDTYVSEERAASETFMHIYKHQCRQFQKTLIFISWGTFCIY
jgi:hypothetical protein